MLEWIRLNDCDNSFDLDFLQFNKKLMEDDGMRKEDAVFMDYGETLQNYKNRLLLRKGKRGDKNQKYDQYKLIREKAKLNMEHVKKKQLKIRNWWKSWKTKVQRNSTSLDMSIRKIRRLFDNDTRVKHHPKTAMLLNKINAKKLHARNRTFQINDLPNDYLLQLNNFDMWKTILHFIAVLNLFILIILLIKFVFNFYAAKNGLKRLQDQIYNSMMLAVENLKSKKYNIQAVINSGLENVKQHNYCDQLRQQEMATSVQS